MNRPNNRRQRWQLLRLWFEQDGRCCWCQGWCVVMPPIPKRDDFGPDEATLDHLYSRNHPERGRHEGEKCRVMACRRCNQERGAAEERAAVLARKAVAAAAPPAGLYSIESPEAREQKMLLEELPK